MEKATLEKAVLEKAALKKVLIFGNSGSGKSTLAAQLSCSDSLTHLDLDTLAWLPSNPPQRAPLVQSQEKIQAFTEQHNSWVIEGCYTDLLTFVSHEATEIIFMNLSIDQCIDNARRRPWEPHKYPSKEAQDSNLPMLVDWITDYMTRQDVFSYQSHLLFYKQFTGKKTMLTRNVEQQ